MDRIIWALTRWIHTQVLGCNNLMRSRRTNCERTNDEELPESVEHRLERPSKFFEYYLELATHKSQRRWSPWGSHIFTVEALEISVVSTSYQLKGSRIMAEGSRRGAQDGELRHHSLEFRYTLEFWDQKNEAASEDRFQRVLREYDLHWRHASSLETYSSEDLLVGLGTGDVPTAVTTDVAGLLVQVLFSSFRRISTRFSHRLMEGNRDPGQPKLSRLRKYPCITMIAGRRDLRLTPYDTLRKVYKCKDTYDENVSGSVNSHEVWKRAKIKYEIKVPCENLKIGTPLRSGAPYETSRDEYRVFGLDLRSKHRSANQMSASRVSEQENNTKFNKRERMPERLAYLYDNNSIAAGASHPPANADTRRYSE
ncbi:hypothetical protein F5146DRAFT_994428 [Armillaria mellea]|nr:hypothetical protein F5146DRAFT_994428 [Armillaria mellea]